MSDASIFHPNPRRTGSDLGVKAERGRAGRKEEEKQLYSSVSERIVFIFFVFSLHLLMRNSIFSPTLHACFCRTQTTAKLTAANWKA